jgi:hypothetical protein
MSMFHVTRVINLKARASLAFAKVCVRSKRGDELHIHLHSYEHAVLHQKVQKVEQVSAHVHIG